MAETAWLSLVAMLKLPHWLMIAGAFLVVTGSIGVLVGAKKTKNTVDANTHPDAATDTPRRQMAPSPNLLDSKRKPRKNDDGRTSKEQGPPA